MFVSSLYNQPLGAVVLKICGTCLLVAACLLVKYCSGREAQEVHVTLQGGCRGPGVVKAETAKPAPREPARPPPAPKRASTKKRASKKSKPLYRKGHERPEAEFCPICTLPIPLPVEEHSMFNLCCMKRVCDGCLVAMDQRGMGDTCASAGLPFQKTMNLLLQ